MPQSSLFPDFGWQFYYYSLWGWKSFYWREWFSRENKLKKVDKKFVNRNGNVVPLQSKDWTRTGLQPTFVIFQVWGAVHVATCRWERSDLSRKFPSKSQSGRDSWRKYRGRIKQQKTHIRSLTDLHTTKRARLVLVTKFVEFTLICDNSWKKLSTALRYTQNSGQKKLIVSRQPIFINLNNLIPWKTRCKDTISFSYLQEFYIFFIWNFTLIKRFAVPFKVRFQNQG